MNSYKTFLIILGLFSIIWQLPGDAMAKPINKEGTFFYYDDDLDYFHLRPQQKPREKQESKAGENLYQMPYKAVRSEDDAELALMSDMSIYTDDDEAWEHEHGRSGIFRGLARDHKLRSLPAAKKPLPQPLPLPLFPSYPLNAGKPFYAPKSPDNVMDANNMSVGKWNWMEKVLRQQVETL
ncbi:hypothetical protein KR038_001222 [Drosophila bunnanda]|nr:hypothetical protein KR038_001222 [Drosophila bunnanda]